MTKDNGWPKDLKVFDGAAAIVMYPDGGRGFGFTGGHVHWNWKIDDQRKLMLNTIAWIAKLEVPSDGVPSKTGPTCHSRPLTPEQAADESGLAGIMKERFDVPGNGDDCA